MTLPAPTHHQRRSRRAAAVGAGAVATVVLRRTAHRRSAARRPPSPVRAEPRAALPSERSRWSVVLAYGLLAAATQALLVNYAPVTADAARHFHVSITAVGWLSQVFPLVYVVVAIPAGLVLDRFFRPALVAGAVLTASGAFLRLVADDYTWALVGQVVAAVGQPFVLNAITGLAVAYLAEKDRATGIALASAATFGGMVVGYLLGAFLPGEHHVRMLTLITAVIAMDAALCLVGALRLVPPLGGPGAFGALGAVRGSGGLGSFRAAFGNRHLRRLCVVVTIPMGTFIALATFAQPLLEPAGVSESSAGLILALTMIAGVIGCAVVPVWADRHRREIPLMGAGIAITAAACLHLALVPSTPMAYLTLIGVGFALLPTLPIVLALTERHAPEAESTAAGLVWLAGNLGGVVIATVVGLLATRPSTAFVALAAVTVLALPAVRWFRQLEEAGAGV